MTWKKFLLYYTFRFAFYILQSSYASSFVVSKSVWNQGESRGDGGVAWVNRPKLSLLEAAHSLS